MAADATVGEGEVARCRGGGVEPAAVATPAWCDRNNSTGTTTQPAVADVDVRRREQWRGRKRVRDELPAYAACVRQLRRQWEVSPLRTRGVDANGRAKQLASKVHALPPQQQ
jgi:hypothetical protein